MWDMTHKVTHKVSEINQREWYPALLEKGTRNRPKAEVIWVEVPFHFQI